MWNLDLERTTVLVTGGSQGALHVDETVAQAVPLLAGRSDIQLVVLTGAAHEQIVATAAHQEMESSCGPCPSSSGWSWRFPWRISRSPGRERTRSTSSRPVDPAILVPYPHATDAHQEANARELVRAGAADVYRDRELTPDGLARRILSLVGDRERRTVMAKEGAAWAKPDADERVAPSW